MPDFIPNLLIWLWNLRYPESWVRIGSGLTMVLLISSLVSILLFTTEIVDGVGFWRVFACLAILLAIIWAIARQAYWRSGSRRKIGVFFRAFNVHMDNWCEVRSHLTSLLKRRELRDPISIRCFPEAWFNDKRRLDKVRKKYRLTATMHVTISPKSESNTNPVWHYGINISSPGNVSRDFSQATKRHATTLLATPPPNGSLLQLLHWQAERFAECFLLNIAVLEYAERNYDSAAALLRVLDKSISSRFGNEMYPRHQIRFLESLCLTDQSVFPGDLPPGPDALDEAIKKCEEGIRRFGNQFPYIFSRQGRNHFYAGDLIKALELTSQSLQLATDTGTRLVAKLNIAVLHLFMTNWANAETAFRQFFAEPEWRKFHWDDLVGFADFARDVGYECAIYLQALYRNIARVTVPKEMTEELTTWLNGDESRTRLLYLFNEMVRTDDGQNAKGGRGRRNKQRRKRR